MSSFRCHQLTLLILFVVSTQSLMFMNRWDTCVDVAVETNAFPLSLLQSSNYYQVCQAADEHWRRFGSSVFRMHILRKSEPFVDKYIHLQHNGYVHFHNETFATVAKWYGASHEDL